MDPDDLNAVHATIAGDRSAYATLVERFSGPLSALAYDRLGTVADAQDAVQNALIAGFEQIDSLKDPQSFGAWIYTILRNECAMRLRSMGIDRRAKDVVAERRAGDRPLTPLERVEVAERRQQLRSAVERLSPPLREAVVLRYLGGATRQQAAQMLDVSLDALDKRMERALRELRDRLDHLKP